MTVMSNIAVSGLMLTLVVGLIVVVSIRGWGAGAVRRRSIRRARPVGSRASAPIAVAEDIERA